MSLHKQMLEVQEADKLLARNDKLQLMHDAAVADAQQQAARARKLEACVSLCKDSKSALNLADARKALKQLQQAAAAQVS